LVPDIAPDGSPRSGRRFGRLVARPDARLSVLSITSGAARSITAVDVGQVAAVALTSGLVSGVVVALVDHVLQGRRRTADVREARRNDAARIVGPALASLRDLEPQSNIGTLRGHPEASDALKEKWAAWLAAAGELEVLGATHPNTPVDERCQSVITNGTSLLNRIHSGVRGGDALRQGQWDELDQLHATAIADARQLVQDVLDLPA
jgi:hypothetical protein